MTTVRHDPERHPHKHHPHKWYLTKRPFCYGSYPFYSLIWRRPVWPLPPWRPDSRWPVLDGGEPWVTGPGRVDAGGVIAYKWIIIDGGWP